MFRDVINWWKLRQLQSRVRALKAELAEAKKYKTYYEHRAQECKEVIGKLGFQIMLIENANWRGE